MITPTAAKVSEGMGLVPIENRKRVTLISAYYSDTSFHIRIRPHITNLPMQYTLTCSAM